MLRKLLNRPRLLTHFALSVTLFLGARVQAADDADTAERVLNRVQAILDGETITQVLNEIQASGENFPEVYKAALWDLYKAKIGREWIGTGANQREVDAKGARRRFWIQAGATRLRPLLAIQLKEDGRSGATIQSDLEQAVEGLYLQSMKEEGMTKAHAVYIAMDDAFNVIHNYVDPNQGKADLNIRGTYMKKILRKLPAAHRRALYPIFIIKKTPGQADDGGTWRHGAVAGAWQGAEREARSGVPYKDLQKLLPVDAQGRPTEGIIGLTQESVVKSDANRDDSDPVPNAPNHTAGTATNGWAWTILHEAGHNIDYRLKLDRNPNNTSQPAKKEHIPGQRYRTDDPPVGERIAEAYSRYFLRRAKICATIAENTPEQVACGQTVVSYLQKQPAFAGITLR